MTPPFSFDGLPTMLDIKWIRENPQVLADALASRGQSPEAAESTVSDLIEKDEARRAHLGELQQKQERRNAASKEIGLAMKEKNAARADELKAEVARIKEDFPKWEQEERDAVKAVRAAIDMLEGVRGAR